MKRNYSLLCLVLLCAMVQGQVASDSLQNARLKNTLSVNVSSLLEKLVRPNPVPDLNSSFLYYSRNFKRFFIRAGVNGWNDQQVTTDLKTKEKTTANNFFSSASLGAYLTKNVGRNFSVGYGLNFIGAYVDSSVTYVTSVDEVENYAHSKHIGFAPGILFTYKVGKRISLFAEYLIPVKFIFYESGTRYSLFPEENSANKEARTFSVLFYNPLHVFLSYSF